MKLLACDLCHSVVPLTKRLKSCRCKNIKGRYLDQKNIIVYVRDKSSCRVLGLSNAVRYGFSKEGAAWIINFNDQTIKKLIEL